MKITRLIWGSAAACVVLVAIQLFTPDWRDEPAFTSELSPVSVTDSEGDEPVRDAEPEYSESTIKAGSPEVDGYSDVDLYQKLAGMPTTHDHQEARDHRYARGYFPLDQIPVYESYTLEALEDLSDTGDFAASHVLALRYSDQGRFEDMQAVWLRAAMFGSTGALDMYASFNIQRADPVHGEKDPALAHQRLLQGLAAYEFARIRGNLLVDKNLEQIAEIAGVNVLEEDMEVARKIGRAMYERAAQERARRGLPPFDDSVSDGARAVYEYTPRTNNK